MSAVERLEELLENSAPRPWTYVEWGSSDDRPASIGYEPRPGHRYAIAMQPRYDGGPFKTHATLICAMREALPDLLKLAMAAKSRRDSGRTHSAACSCADCEDVSEALVALFREVPS